MGPLKNIVQCDNNFGPPNSVTSEQKVMKNIAPQKASQDIGALQQGPPSKLLTCIVG